MLPEACREDLEERRSSPGPPPVPAEARNLPLPPMGGSQSPSAPPASPSPPPRSSPSGSWAAEEAKAEVGGWSPPVDMRCDDRPPPPLALSAHVGETSSLIRRSEAVILPPPLEARWRGRPNSLNAPAPPPPLLLRLLPPPADTLWRTEEGPAAMSLLYPMVVALAFSSSPPTPSVCFSFLDALAEEKKPLRRGMTVPSPVMMFDFFLAKAAFLPFLSSWDSNRIFIC